MGDELGVKGYSSRFSHCAVTPFGIVHITSLLFMCVVTQELWGSLPFTCADR